MAWRLVILLSCFATTAAVVAHGGSGPQVVLNSELGEIRLRMLPDAAPQHVQSFVSLARSGFYDGTTFHRVLPGYLIQGGSPTSRDDDDRNDNIGDPGFALAAEPSRLRHRRGAVAMARDMRGDGSSSGSQFFIVLGRAPLLDEIGFTVFARVVSGLDVADRIAAAPRDIRNYDRPLAPVVVTRVRVEEPSAGVSEQPSVGASAQPGAGLPLAATASGDGGTSTPVAPHSLSSMHDARVAGPVSRPRIPLVTLPRERTVGSQTPPPMSESPGDDQTVPSTLVVNVSRANVRGAPGVGYPIVTRLWRDTEVRVIERSGRWYRIDLGEDRVGWLRDDTVEASSTPEP